MKTHEILYFNLSKAIMIGCMTIMLQGCAGKVALKESFQNFSQTYANLSNEQMLLNLARRANAHASYFMQMSSINASFSFGASAGLNSSLTRTKTDALTAVADAITKVFTYGGTLGVTATESPTFSFAPLSGATFARAVYTPIDSKIFFEQLRQGVPVNQLMRIMVVAVILDYPSGKRLTLNNIPDEERPENFRNFLRLAGLARQMQLHQMLRIDTIEDKNVLTVPKQALPLLTRLYSDPDYSFWQGSHLNIGVEDGTPQVSFIMRPFSGVLGALGESQRHFGEWLNSGVKLDEIPETERRPILTINWGDKEEGLTLSAAEVEYLGKTYKIADLDGKHSTWNRDSFRILNDLFTIVSLEPKELPVQQLIKVF